MASVITENDENLHPVGDDPKWSEGMYVNWSTDHVFGFAIFDFRFLSQCAPRPKPSTDYVWRSGSNTKADRASRQRRSRSWTISSHVTRGPNPGDVYQCGRRTRRRAATRMARFHKAPTGLPSAWTVSQWGRPFIGQL